MKMYRVSTSTSLKVEILTAKRIHLGAVVYMGDNGSEYKEDLIEPCVRWFEDRNEVQRFINDTYHKEEKLARDKQRSLTNMLKNVGEKDD